MHPLGFDVSLLECPGVLFQRLTRDLPGRDHDWSNISEFFFDGPLTSCDDRDACLNSDLSPGSRVFHIAQCAFPLVPNNGGKSVIESAHITRRDRDGQSLCQAFHRNFAERTGIVAFLTAETCEVCKAEPIAFHGLTPDPGTEEMYATGPRGGVRESTNESLQLG